MLGRALRPALTPLAPKPHPKLTLSELGVVFLADVVLGEAHDPKVRCYVVLEPPRGSEHLRGIYVGWWTDLSAFLGLPSNGLVGSKSFSKRAGHPDIGFKEA